jgi:nitrite reductase (NO-forming)
MHGGILIDPEEPLPPADQEFYIVQSEYYTNGTEPGLVEMDRQALTDEHPTMVVFNGAKGALTGDNTLNIDVGERARIFFVNSGLNLDSNFHPIGSHWDAVWPESAYLSAPIRGSQTTLVAAGGSVTADLIGQVPSQIVLVDHALVRTFDKGAIGLIQVNGDANREIFEAMGADAGGETAAAGDPTGIPVEIAAGSFRAADVDAADQFADDENPADYLPNVLRVKVGDTVTWTNADETLHTITAVDESFDSGFLALGDSWSYTFDTPGEFEYFCLPHPWMRAKVIVEA